MILDDYNSNLYLGNKIIHLTETENKLLAFFLKNKNRAIPLEEISSNVFLSTSATYALIRKINNIIMPYSGIYVRHKRGYVLNTKPYKGFFIWKKQFIQTHKDTYTLLKLYKQRENLEKKIKILEKNLF